MAVKSTPTLNAFNLFASLLGLTFIVGLLPHGSITPERTPERRVRDADEKAQPVSVAKVNAEQKAGEAYGQLPLSFEENRGQAGGAVNFMARGADYKLALTSTGAIFALAQQSE